MKKRLLFLITLCVMSLLVFAEMTVYVHKKDGTKVPYVAATVDSIGFVDAINVNPNSHDYVDLGLSSGSLWATCNVGADSPEELGDYFAWGEIEQRSSSNWEYYKWANVGDNKVPVISKYCEIDNQTVLDLCDDVARIKWGGDWKMPTKEDFDELLSQCTWTLETRNGVKGYLVSGSNGNSIFLPNAGYTSSALDNSRGYYWSSSLYTSGSYGAYYLFLNPNKVGRYCYERRYAMSVRPIIRLGSSYNMTFASNGGIGSMNSTVIDREEEFTLPENEFIHQGYFFSGWNTREDGSGVNYSPGDRLSITSNITFYAQWRKHESIGTFNGRDWVDLGLPSGVLWATCNVGANSPEEYGEYYAWGELEPYEYEYTFISSYRNILGWREDIANVEWGGTWRIPTNYEIQELINNCLWEWCNVNGIYGYKVTGSNGNTIFLPAGGHKSTKIFSANELGNYWSNTLHDYKYGTDPIAYLMFFSSDKKEISFQYANDGKLIRPVLGR